jgi:hypothetical protein
MNKTFSIARVLEHESAMELKHRVKDIVGKSIFLTYEGGLLTSIITHKDISDPNTICASSFSKTRFELARNRFNFVEFEPWDTVVVRSAGAIAINNTLAVVLDRPQCMKQERRALLKLAGVSKNSRKRNDSIFIPTITVARFTETNASQEVLHEYEAALQHDLESIDITLQPVTLKSNFGTNWQFEPRQVATRSLPVEA